MRIPFLIGGGGIGGPATALALSRTGCAVHLIEKDDEFEEIGAGLQPPPKASRMLHRCVLDEIAKSAIYPKRLVWRDAVSGKLLTAVNLGEPFQQRYRYRHIVMQPRGSGECSPGGLPASDRISLERGKRAIAVEDLGDGTRAAAADGAIYDCDAVIAADGLWSTVRKFVHDDGDPVCSKIWRIAERFRRAGFRNSFLPRMGPAPSTAPGAPPLSRGMGRPGSAG